MAVCICMSVFPFRWRCSSPLPLCSALRHHRHTSIRTSLLIAHTCSPHRLPTHTSCGSHRTPPPRSPTTPCAQVHFSIKLQALVRRGNAIRLTTTLTATLRLQRQWRRHAQIMALQGRAISMTPVEQMPPEQSPLKVEQMLPPSPLPSPPSSDEGNTARAFRLPMHKLPSQKMRHRYGKVAKWETIPPAFRSLPEA